ncbi:MAG: glycosyltransferase [Aliifodinibius sp.]|nr:glycosyltransferase [Fodinibius sp.]
MNKELNTSFPELSVVVVTLGGREYIPRCLSALQKQEHAVRQEIIVPCDDRIFDVEALRQQFPDVNFVSVKGRLTYAELRAIGFQKAQGKIIALTEDHCLPRPEWCANILKHHAETIAAVGGSVVKNGKDTRLNWAIYLSDFGRYMPPVKEGPSMYLTDCNVSYKREALTPIFDLWKKEFHETTVNWTLQKQGKILLLAPDVVVDQQRSLTYQVAFRERYAFGRLFASTRVAATSSIKRLFYTCFSVFLPGLILARVAKNVFLKRRAIGTFFTSIPAILFLGIAWAWGEFIGYLSGRPATTLKPDY